MDIKKFTTGHPETKYSNRRWEIKSTPVFTTDGELYWEQLRSLAPAVVVVPVNDDDQIAIISQNRILVDGQCHIVSEFPSGWVEENSHNPDLTKIAQEANRELQEEIGFEAQKLELLTQFQLGNFAVVPYYIFLATGLKAHHLDRDLGEVVKVDWLSFDQAEERLLRSQIPTAQVYIALHAYKNYLVK